MPSVSMSVDDHGVALVVVDNPPVNAMSDLVIDGLTALAENLRTDDVDAVVLTGAGSRMFLAGADLVALEGWLGDEGAIARHVEMTTRLFSAWASLPQPTLAAVQGDALGGGLELAMACDLIVANPGVRLGLPEVKLGLMPGAGGTQRLPRRVGAGQAARLVLTGTAVDAQEAKAIGLVDQVCAEGKVEAVAMAIAADMASSGPRSALRAVTAALRSSATDSLESGLARERELFLRQTLTADAAEGVRAFREKRAPRYE